jgi:hypothetical protein
MLANKKGQVEGECDEANWRLWLLKPKASKIFTDERTGG